MKILVSSIVSVQVVDSYKLYSWEEITFRREKKFWGIAVRKAGWYDALDENKGMDYPEEYAKVSFPTGGKGYYKPHVIIRTTDRNRHHKYFDTLKEAQEYADSIDIMVDKRTIEI